MRELKIGEEVLSDIGLTKFIGTNLNNNLEAIKNIFLAKISKCSFLTLYKDSERDLLHL